MGIYLVYSVISFLCYLCEFPIHHISRWLFFQLCLTLSEEVMVWGFVRHPSVSQLSQNLFGGFLSNLSCYLPCAIYAQTFFDLKKNNAFSIFSRFFFFFVNMGAYGSKNYKTLLVPQLLLNCFKLLLNFLLGGPNKHTVLNF